MLDKPKNQLKNIEKPPEQTWKLKKKIRFQEISHPWSAYANNCEQIIQKKTPKKDKTAQLHFHTHNIYNHVLMK